MPGNLGSSAGEAKDESDILIECRDVHKSFGEKKILRGVSFKVVTGNILVPYLVSVVSISSLMG